MRVCFSCPMARPVFDPAAIGSFGGSEVRAYTFATGLARLGTDVNVIVQAHDAALHHYIAGVRMHYRRTPAPLPRLRDEPSVGRRLRLWPFVASRRLVRSLNKRIMRSGTDVPTYDSVLAQVDADVYCSFGVHQHSASVVFTAAQLGRPSLLLIASDTDLSETYADDSRRRNEYRQRGDVCYFALSRATRIVAQTNLQQHVLLKRFGRESTVIRNPIDCHGPRPVRPTPVEPTDVLWIGRADRFSKRADLAMALASRCPELRFRMIMNPRDPKVFREIMNSVPTNVEVVPQVPWQEMESQFQSARVLVNTSDAEGFPNSFLQAAQLGVPIVSLNVDPNRMLTSHGCGVFVAGKLQGLASAVSDLVDNSLRRDSIRKAGATYVDRFHAAPDRCIELERLLSEAVVNSSDLARPRGAA